MFCQADVRVFLYAQYIIIYHIMQVKEVASQGDSEAGRESGCADVLA